MERSGAEREALGEVEGHEPQPLPQPEVGLAVKKR